MVLLLVPVRPRVLVFGGTGYTVVKPAALEMPRLRTCFRDIDTGLRSTPATRPSAEHAERTAASGDRWPPTMTADEEAAKVLTVWPVDTERQDPDPGGIDTDRRNSADAVVVLMGGADEVAGAPVVGGSARASARGGALVASGGESATESHGASCGDCVAGGDSTSAGCDGPIGGDGAVTVSEEPMSSIR